MVRRAGFGLVEVIVAMTLVGIGVMSIAASAAFATNMLRRSENLEDAARIAGMLVDSLAFSHTAAAGARDIGRFRAVWSADEAGDLEVEITVRDASAGDTMIVHAHMLPRIPLLPCDSQACND